MPVRAMSGMFQISGPPFGSIVPWRRVRNPKGGDAQPAYASWGDHQAFHRGDLATSRLIATIAISSMNPRGQRAECDAPTRRHVLVFVNTIEYVYLDIPRLVE